MDVEAILASQRLLAVVNVEDARAVAPHYLKHLREAGHPAVQEEVMAFLRSAWPAQLVMRLGFLPLSLGADIPIDRYVPKWGGWVVWKEGARHSGDEA